MGRCKLPTQLGSDTMILPRYGEDLMISLQRPGVTRTTALVFRQTVSVRKTAARVESTQGLYGLSCM